MHENWGNGKSGSPMLRELSWLTFYVHAFLGIYKSIAFRIELPKLTWRLIKASFCCSISLGCLTGFCLLLFLYYLEELKIFEKIQMLISPIFLLGLSPECRGHSSWWYLGSYGCNSRTTSDTDFWQWWGITYCMNWTEAALSAWTCLWLEIKFVISLTT